MKSFRFQTKVSASGSVRANEYECSDEPIYDYFCRYMQHRTNRNKPPYRIEWRLPAGIEYYSEPFDPEFDATASSFIGFYYECTIRITVRSETEEAARFEMVKYFDTITSKRGSRKLGFVSVNALDEWKLS